MEIARGGDAPLSFFNTCDVFDVGPVSARSHVGGARTSGAQSSVGGACQGYCWMSENGDSMVI